jgi:hypothetical protein
MEPAAPPKPASSPKPAAPTAPAQARPATIDVGEIWAEAEFYFQQGLFDEARKHYAKIIEHTPGDKRALNRLMEISREEEETQEFTNLPMRLMIWEARSPPLHPRLKWR